MPRFTRKNVGQARTARVGNAREQRSWPGGRVPGWYESSNRCSRFVRDDRDDCEDRYSTKPLTEHKRSPPGTDCARRERARTAELARRASARMARVIEPPLSGSIPAIARVRAVRLIANVSKKNGGQGRTARVGNAREQRSWPEGRVPGWHESSNRRSPVRFPRSRESVRRG
jgi:hypothetical protein